VIVDDPMMAIIDHFYESVSDIFDYEDFIELAEQFDKYYDSRKKYVIIDACQIIECCNRIKFDDPLLYGTQLVIMTSIIEKLNKRVRRLRFDKWYKKNEEKYANKKCTNAWNDYNVIYGSGKSFRKFFDLLSDEEKLNLLLKIRRVDLITRENTPFCFRSQDDCFHSSVWCKGVNDRPHCPALQEDKVLTKGIKKLADHLYSLRSKFVHESDLPNFSYKFEMPDIDDNVPMIQTENTSAYYRCFDENDNEHWFESTLEITEFYDLIKKYLPSMLRNYLSEIPYSHDAIKG